VKGLGKDVFSRHGVAGIRLRRVGMHVPGQPVPRKSPDAALSVGVQHPGAAVVVPAVPLSINPNWVFIRFR
jgi:hypothetical protein